MSRNRRSHSRRKSSARGVHKELKLTILPDEHLQGQPDANQLGMMRVFLGHLPGELFWVRFPVCDHVHWRSYVSSFGSVLLRS